MQELQENARGWKVLFALDEFLQLCESAMTMVEDWPSCLIIVGCVQCATTIRALNYV